MEATLLFLALGSQLCELPDAEAIRRLMSKNLRKDALESMEVCGQYFSRETLRRIEGELEQESPMTARSPRKMKMGESSF